ncbi:esterase-like activity of phytase family protein [Parasphingopyxis sp. CP4]|uniref:esterase-like activity of phytase family protein n=1 Tax=Parasphingopyxis sp. CP4 TaxID=2724527 RepID=UPI00159FE8E3|nr:esterase-like activity of phytase family protein [Parasphingopyxis sp. CP4]QLC22384.1 esterase-like activity of phytase family protein [Parasphingopyxis sp. CP4]
MLRRVAAALVVFFVAGSVVLMGAGQRAEPGNTLAIQAVPTVLDPTNPDRRDMGPLRFLAGWTLNSGDPDFGGISAIARVDDGFVAIGDAGGIFRFALDERGQISRADIGEVPAGPIPPNGGAVQKRDRDAEAMAFDPETGRFWVAFERANGLWRYDRDFTGSDANHAPDAMDDWPNNGGAEAVVRFDDGRFLVFSEAGNGPGSSREVLLFASDPSDADVGAPIRLGYHPPAEHRITDAALLPDGQLLVLNRDFSVVRGVSVIISLVDISQLDSGTILTGDEIARLVPPLTVDNMEAIAIEEVDGRTIVWIASDDNFNPLQRTLLMQFEWTGG